MAVLVALLAASHALIPESSFPLSTRGSHIVSADGTHAHLQCGNWYGAHMETHAVAGLHVRSLSNISAEIVRIGLNCVRLPMSLEMWFENPLVRPAAVEGDAVLLAAATGSPRLRALELFDRTVEALSAAGIAVLLNNHNSQSGWCCDVASEEGLWSTSRYNASRWVEALAALAARYRHLPLVFGIDLRNEIHDVAPAGLVTTWGTSSDLETDWKVATEAAALAIHRVAPDLLILVSGLCFSFDLRLLIADPPRIPTPAKLVWTVHYCARARLPNLPPPPPRHMGRGARAGGPRHPPPRGLPSSRAVSARQAAAFSPPESRPKPHPLVRTTPTSRPRLQIPLPDAQPS